MISNYNMFEGRVLGTTAAIASGILGGPIGAAGGLYQRYKYKKKKGEDMDVDDLAYGIAGTIPIVGAATNAMAAKRRYKLEKKK